MRRIHLTIEYDGTNYAGWQRQSNAPTVQETVEKALHRLTREEITLHGASRTDAGVHALGQSAHFDTVSRIPGEKFAFALNTMLPDDVRIRASEDVPEAFHARFSSKGKRYRYLYKVAPHAGALDRLTHAHIIYPLDMPLMQQELRSIVGTHDFKAFAASGSVVVDTVRTIRKAELSRDGDEMCLIVEGNGFLYNMVRIIAGTLANVGSGLLEPGAFARALQSGSRLDLGVTAPAKGLTLMRVFYDESEAIQA